MRKIPNLGKTVLRMKFRKELTLNNVIHAFNIQNNMVFGSLLSKNKFIIVFKPDKFILTRNEIFVDKGVFK
jgi:hypothetical protein